ncbi:MAG: protein arginine kinase [Elusimicrobia bacterium]|nr:protein arginine kinase [Elusimicrobiota bacterium]
MKIGEIFRPYISWANGQGDWPDIVFSTRGRFARNVYGFSFPPRASKEKLKELAETAMNAVKKSRLFIKAHCIHMDELDGIEKAFLVERHHISHNLASQVSGAAVVVSSDETMSIMINEEDHLRIQSISSGLSIKRVYENIETMDSQLGRILPYAYSRQFGFLTACPTNAGTGFRISCLVHLPALARTGQMAKVLENLSTLGITARGIYGEGTYVLGDFYQISNATCLGRSEQEFAENLNRVVNNLIRHEIHARENLIKGGAKAKTEDGIFRSLGILKNARMLSYEEFMQHISLVRMGAAMGLDMAIDISSINQLTILMQPAHLQTLAGRKLDQFERDVERAGYLRKKL